MDFQQLISNINQIEKKDKSLKVDDFYVGKGVIDCDNFFIPLDAVSRVSIARQPGLPRTLCIIIAILGLLWLLLPVGELRIFGLFIILAGGFLWWIAPTINKNRICYLTIKLNNNTTQIFESKNKDFLLKVMDVMERCINDRRGGYDVSITNQTINYTDDHSVGKITNNGGTMSDIKPHIVGRDDNHFVNYGNDVNVTIKHGLTEDDWKILEQFFSEKMKSVKPNSNNYKAYEQMKNTAINKDEKRLSDMMKKIGKDSIETVIVSGVGEVFKAKVLPILLSLL